MKVLVLTNGYPDPSGGRARMFVHVRNTYYMRHGLSVDVLDFSAKHPYEIDGIQVITEKEYRRGNYDVAICHSCNLRHHYRFMKKHENDFRHIFFFFHGFEILYMNKSYPKPYPYMPEGKLVLRAARAVYDWLRINVWAKYYMKLACKSDFIFVSNWILEKFKENIMKNNISLGGVRYTVINNSVGAPFQNKEYDFLSPKQYDCITIRSNLDGSKYSIDTVCQFAESNPDMRFLVIGRGKYFKYNKMPDNMTLIEDILGHEEILYYLNQSRCAFMPTRQDTQGVMTCEMATFGMPVITSDIAVCHEFFDGLPNVRLIKTGQEMCNLSGLIKELEEHLPYDKPENWFAENTTQKELELINRVMSA